MRSSVPTFWLSVGVGLVVALLGVILWLGRGGGSPDHGRVIVLALDGVDPRVVDLLVSEGRLANFARLRQEGAYGVLESAKPLLSPVVWTTIATGKTPDQHGIGHFVAVDPTTGESLPVTSQMRRVKAVWNILSDHDRSVAVVGWWATWPAEVVKGAIVSDHTCYHFLFPQEVRGDSTNTGITYPTDLLSAITPLIRRPADITARDAAPFISVPDDELSRPFDFDDEVSHFRWALATADSYRAIGRQLWRQNRPAVLMVYTEATDSLAHLFGHLFRAEGLVGELKAQSNRYGHAVEEMYVYADRLIGEYMQEMDDNTTLMVLSDHGFALGVAPTDPSKTRDMRRVSERYHRIEGILYLYGPHIRPGAISGAKIIDIAPTLLALTGVGAAHDMPGRVLQEALKGKPPQRTVATFESTLTPATPVAHDPAVDDEIKRRLGSLGYLAGSGSTPTAAPHSPQGDRNLAALEFEKGRYAQSVAIYQRLLAADPNDGDLHASIAGVLAALRRFDQALPHLDRAIALDPMNSSAYHNRAAILEHQGRTDEAIGFYREALRYNSEYEPSRAALLRLTGSAQVRTPHTAEERRAADLAQRASNVARRGDYATATKLLGEAESIAPNFVLVFQYQANVAYLMGDSPRAIRALERALALEPANALFRNNLDHLRRGIDPKPR